VSTTTHTERQYWLWVTRPEYYLDDDGNDREDLDPTNGNDTDGWWTCHENTQRGDLVFLWRTAPRKDIGYLIQAASDAYSIADDRYAVQHRWDYGCDYQVLYKFKNPVNIQDLHNDPRFHDLPAYRGRFQRRVFRIPPEYWKKLNELASQKNVDYREFIETVQQEAVFKSIALEEQLEEALVQNLSLLKKFGYDLELYIDPDTGRTGRQFVCKGNGGRIDLLCYDRREKRYVVIELKNVKASQNTIGQICNYMGWVQDRIAGQVPVIGLVISRGCDAKFESASRVTKHVFSLDIEQLGFR
jgi:hypothetical protein